MILRKKFNARPCGRSLPFRSYIFPKSLILFPFLGGTPGTLSKILLVRLVHSLAIAIAMLATTATDLQNEYIHEATTTY